MVTATQNLALSPTTKKTAGASKDSGGLLYKQQSAYFMNTIFLVAEKSSVWRW
jgi:hypothetical protein